MSIRTAVGTVFSAATWSGAPPPLPRRFPDRVAGRRRTGRRLRRCPMRPQPARRLAAQPPGQGQPPGSGAVERPAESVGGKLHPPKEPGKSWRRSPVRSANPERSSGRRIRRRPGCFPVDAVPFQTVRTPRCDPDRFPISSFRILSICVRTHRGTPRSPGEGQKDVLIVLYGFKAGMKTPWQCDCKSKLCSLIRGLYGKPILQVWTTKAGRISGHHYQLMQTRVHKTPANPTHAAATARCPHTRSLPIAAMHCRVCFGAAPAQYASGTRPISRARRTASARLRAPSLANSLRMW